MNDSILTSIKKQLNIAESDTSFDQEIIMDINMVFMIIMQEWYGVDHAFRIEDKTSTWDDFLGESETDYEGLKTLIALKVRLIFDPPTNSSLMEAINRQIEDLEWRMYLWKDNLRIDAEHATPEE